MLKFGSGARVTRVVPSSDTCVLHASRGLPLMNMPQDPQTPIRHDDRHASVGDSVSLMDLNPSSTVMPGGYGTR